VVSAQRTDRAQKGNRRRRRRVGDGRSESRPAERHDSGGASIVRLIPAAAILRSGLPSRGLRFGRQTGAVEPADRALVVVPEDLHQPRSVVSPPILDIWENHSSCARATRSTSILRWSWPSPTHFFSPSKASSSAQPRRKSVAFRTPTRRKASSRPGTC